MANGMADRSRPADASSCTDQLAEEPAGDLKLGFEADQMAASPSALRLSFAAVETACSDW
jgi:hypothetical protein